MASRKHRFIKHAGPAGLILVVCGTLLLVVTIVKTILFVPEYTSGINTDLPEAFDTTRAINQLSQLIAFETIGDRSRVDTSVGLLFGAKLLVRRR